MQRELDEQERTNALVVRAQAGEREALAELFELYGTTLRRSAQAKLPAALKGRVDSSDVAQDALVDAVAHFDRFEYRGPGSFRRWLGQIVQNRALMTVQRYLGRKKRDVRREVREADRIVPSAGSASNRSRDFAASRTSPSGGAIRGERRDRLRLALARLPDDHRTVLQLVRIEEKSIAEAAAAMQRTENAVKKLLARALLSLREGLDAEGGGASAGRGAGR